MSTTKPFSIEDLRLHRKLADISCSPCHDTAVASVKSVDTGNDGYTSHLWLFRPTAEPEQLTRGPGSDQSPQWSPDGRQIAFLSSRSGGAPQVFVIGLEAGEARQVGQFERGASSLRWDVDGKSLLVTAPVSVDPELRGAAGGPPPTRGESAPEVCWRLPYKSDGVGYLLAREIHLFRVDLASGDSAQLTRGPFSVMAFQPSPDGREIAYSRTREGRFAHCTDLWACGRDGGQPRRLAPQHSTVMQPAWSPDGRWIAFPGAIREGDSESSLWLLDMMSGRVSLLGPPGLEVADPESLLWDTSSQRLTLKRAHRGRHEIVSVKVPGGQLDVHVTGDRQFGVFGRGRSCFFYTEDSPVSPGELVVYDIDGGSEREISSLNAWWRERTPLQLQSRTFEVPDGKGGSEPIEGWLLTAKGAEGPMPLLTDVHGGPASYVLLDYETNVYWQQLASSGWAVLMLNAVGSSSFGWEFCERLSGHWGDLDMPQHLAAVKALQNEGLCDARVAIAGKSYGGFFSAWAIGHTDVFRAAVVMAPVGNLETHYGTSDGGYYADPLYIGTSPVFERKRARDLSPLQSIEQAHTPTLFLQGKDDERCPKCQSEELFVSMFRMGQATTELVLYPGEGHGF
ncbi:MAG: peptidase, partial [Polaromonas sp.]|nr:peptidase [Polaromonas sp.]